MQDDPGHCVLHGSWLPEEDGGLFVIWGEVQKPPPRRKPKGGGHPFHLGCDQLCGLVASVWSDVVGEVGFTSVWAVLPGCQGMPAASPEFQSASGQDAESPDEWRAWRVDAVSVGTPLALLLALDMLRGRPSVRPGKDLAFWSHLADRLAGAIQRHEYLPAIFGTESLVSETLVSRTLRVSAESVGSGGKVRSGKKRRKSGSVPPESMSGTFMSETFTVGWELLHNVIETRLEPLGDCMPTICRSLQEQKPSGLNGTVPLWDARDLIRSFACAELNRQVRGAGLPKTVRKPFAETFIDLALDARPVEKHGTRPSVADAHRGESVPVTQDHWRQWRRWRDRINRAAAQVDEQICFRLTDPPDGTPDVWRLEWLLASRKDPSRLVPLKGFWSSDRPAGSVTEVLLQLGQAARLYPELWAGMECDAPDGVDFDREQALAFLHEHGPVLQAGGFRVIVPSWWTASGQRRLRLRINAQSSRSAGAAAAAESSGLLGLESVVDWTPEIVLDGVALSREEWEEIVAAKAGLVYMRGQWMELVPEEIARLQDYWQADGEPAQMTVADLIRAEADEHTQVQARGELEDALRVLYDSSALDVCEQPEGFVGDLRRYQLRGFSWLTCLEGYGLGAILADDMGLGKTVQVLASVQRDRQAHPDGGPTLLVAPTSVLGNWQREAGKFTPGLTTLIHHGNTRARSEQDFRERIEGVDLVIVSFGVARLDRGLMNSVGWRRLVIDEAQNVKNPTAAITRALQAIPAQRRIALTGTPVENRLLDLWSLFNVINPGMLGTVTEFRTDYERPVMRDGDRVALDRLRGIVRPFILRRLKSDRSIISDLPEKVEQNVLCSLTPEQATLYEAIVRDVEERLREESAKAHQGLMLGALTRLKQVCNHPAQFLQDGSAFTVERSHKLGRVCGMLDEIQAEGDSVLLFTQFTEVGRNLEMLLRERGGARVFYLHGGTPRALREDMVEQFQEPDGQACVFVLSLRAAGVGLTLTRASHVIHFDRWWNPAVENQATDRAYRIGQEKMVMVHKMVTIGTLEERIDALIESKKQLAEDVVGADESWLSDMGSDAFRELIRLDRGEAVLS